MFTDSITFDTLQYWYCKFRVNVYFYTDGPAQAKTTHKTSGTSVA